MPKKMPLTHKEALYFFDIIYEPIVRFIKNAPDLKNCLQTTEEYSKVMLKLGELYGHILHDTDKIDIYLQEFQQCMSEKYISESVIKAFLLQLLNTILHSIRNHPNPNISHQAVISNIQKAIDNIDDILNLQQKPTQDSDFASDFVTAFDDDLMDEQINELHTSGEDREVLSAQDYLALGELDEEHILQIIDMIHDAHSITMQSVNLSPHDINELQNAIEEATHALEGAFEFMDLGNVLRQFSELLEQIKSLDNNTRELYKPLVDSFISDLEKWADHVFVKQDAIDIHYLDASLFSSVKQIELLLSTAANDSENQEEMDSFMF